LGWTLEFTVESIFKMVDGLNLLLYELYQKTLTLLYPISEDQNNQAPNLNVIHNEAAAASFNGGRENFRNRDTDYDSSSDDESPEDGGPSIPTEENTPHAEAIRQDDLEISLVEGLRANLQSDLKKTLKKEVSIVKNEIESQIEEKLEMIAVELKATNEALIEGLLQRF